MRPFVVNGHGRLVFPSNFSAELDFSVLETLEQLEAVVKRDFEAKAPTGTEILERVDAGDYDSRAPLLRDLAMNLVWGNRYAMTMYEKRPTRWRDLPRDRDDVFLPLLTPWEQGERKIAAVATAWGDLPPTWDAEAEDGIFASLFEIFRHKRHHATELPPHQADRGGDHERPAEPHLLPPEPRPGPPDPQLRGDPRLQRGGPRARAAAPPRDGAPQPVPVGPGRSRASRRSGRSATTTSSSRSCRAATRCSSSSGACARDVPARPRPAPPAEARAPVAPLPPTVVREQFALMPRLESLTVVKGEHVCTNEDIVRNAAYSWSPMTAAGHRGQDGHPRAALHRAPARAHRPAGGAHRARGRRAAGRRRSAR